MRKGHIELGARSKALRGVGDVVLSWWGALGEGFNLTSKKNGLIRKSLSEYLVRGVV